MATKPLPTIATDSQGRPVKEDEKSKDIKILVDTQKVQLAVFTDILGVVKNIADNMVAGMRAQGLMYAGMDAYLDVARGETKNRLAEKEKEKEAGLDEDAKQISPLGKLFQEYFGSLKRLLTIITAVLIPFLLGFVLSFVDLTKPIDLLKAALVGLAAYIGGKFLLLLAKNLIKNMFLGPKTIMAPGSTIITSGGVGAVGGKGRKGIPKGVAVTAAAETAAAAGATAAAAEATTGAGIFSKLAKGFGGLFRVLGKLFLPITIIVGVIDGIMGAIEGFKDGGVLGGIKGALVGIINGLVGWIVGIGQFIVSGLLDLFGFEDAAKIVDEFNFKEFLEKYSGFLIPIIGLIDLFDESSVVRKTFDKALRNVSNVGNFVSNIWEDITKAIREVLIKLADAVPFGSRLLSWLGIKKPDEEKIAAGGGGTAEDEKAISSAQERLRKEGETEAAEALQEADDIDEAKRMLKKYGFDDKRASELLGVPQASAAPKAVPAPPANTAEELNRKTEEALAKPPEKPQPAVNNTTVVNAPNNIRSTTNMNQAPHAERAGLGSRGNAGFSGFSKAYT
jgi:hypothetical protein